MLSHRTVLLMLIAVYCTSNYAADGWSLFNREKTTITRSLDDTNTTTTDPDSGGGYGGGPTAKPTPGGIVPTKKPTEKKTKRPTPRHTRPPVSYPSERPSDEPTPNPTPGGNVPTKKPTEKKTKRPTPRHTRPPVSYPSEEPSEEPTPNPTPGGNVPTPKPTERKTRRPTDKKTKRPTPRHTPPPTGGGNVPTRRPTDKKTKRPTNNRPTPCPTVEEPTPAPTGGGNVPTRKPTKSHPTGRPCGNPYNILFIIDGSNVANRQGFESAIQFVEDLINEMDIGMKANIVAIEVLGDSNQIPTSSFTDNRASNKADLLDYLSTLNYLGGPSNLVDAIDGGMNLYDNLPQSREKYDNFVFFVTDGIAEMPPVEEDQEIQDIKDAFDQFDEYEDTQFQSIAIGGQYYSLKANVKLRNYISNYHVELLSDLPPYPRQIRELIDDGNC